MSRSGLLPLLKLWVSQQVAATVAAFGAAENAITSLISACVLSYGIYGVCIGILACRGLFLVSSPLQAMKSQSQIQSFAAVKFRGRNQEMSQSLSSNVPDNSPEQEAATEHFIPRRLDSPTSQTAQLPELQLTLTPATGR
ncbi:hypothetical protein Tco_1307194 [Tanacetum coccineum]